MFEKVKTTKNNFVIFLKFRWTARNPKNDRIPHKIRTITEFFGNSAFCVNFCMCRNTGIYDWNWILPATPTALDHL